MDRHVALVATRGMRLASGICDARIMHASTQGAPHDRVYCRAEINSRHYSILRWLMALADKASTRTRHRSRVQLQADFDTSRTHTPACLPCGTSTSACVETSVTLSQCLTPRSLEGCRPSLPSYVLSRDLEALRIFSIIYMASCMCLSLVTTHVRLMLPSLAKPSAVVYGVGEGIVSDCGAQTTPPTARRQASRLFECRDAPQAPTALHARGTYIRYVPCASTMNVFCVMQCAVCRPP